MTRAESAQRSTHAREFLEAAVEATTSHPERTNVAVANAVLAGIAACDALCGIALGECARGEAHGEAVVLVARVAPGGARHATDLRRLLAVKNNAQYSPATLSAEAARTAVVWAGRLVDAAAALVARS